MFMFEYHFNNTWWWSMIITYLKSEWSNSVNYIYPLPLCLFSEKKHTFVINKDVKDKDIHIST